MKNKLSKGMGKDIPLGTVEVIITVLGGGFTHEHKLYAITNDLEVFKTRQFDMKKLANIQGFYIGKLKKLEFPDKKIGKSVVALDSVEIKAYKVENNKLNLFYDGYLGIGDKPKVVRDILSLDF